MAEITEEELLEQKEAIKLFNDSLNGKVNSMELGRLLKSLGCIKRVHIKIIQKFHSGMNPSDKDLSEMMAELDPDTMETLEFPEFVSMLAKKMKNKDSVDDLRAAFSVLDEEGRGMVKAAELRELLVTEMGESEEEVAGMMREVTANKEGEINIDEFIRIVFK